MGRPKDIEKRKKAFKLWKRYNNQTEVANELGVTKALISQWKKEDNWDDKLQRAQGLLQTRLALIKESEDDALLGEDLANLSLLRELESAVLDKVYTEEIEPITWSDVINTLKFSADQKRLLLGKPTSKTETNISIEIKGLSKDELDRRIEATDRALAAAKRREITVESTEVNVSSS